MDAILGGDQLLGLAGETLLRHAQQLVEVGATLEVGELECAAGLHLLEAAIEVRVALGRVVEIGREATRARPRLRQLALRALDTIGQLACAPRLRGQLLDRRLQFDLGRRQLGRQTRRLRLGRLDGFLGVPVARVAVRDLLLQCFEVRLGRGFEGRGALGKVGFLRGDRGRLRGLERCDLGLELLAGSPNLLLELGLTLDELRTMRGGEALDLRLRSTELVFEHGRALLLVAERAEFDARVLELGLCRARLRLRRLERLAAVERVHVRRVQVLLQLLGALRLRTQRLELALGHRQLGL